ncbi:3816_t:CDS:2, partial [Dentiscutata erythropus]
SKALSDTRSKTKEGQRDRQRAYRASLKYCSLDEYQKEKGEKPGLCCMNSEVVLAPLQAPPPEIYYFLTEKDLISKGNYYHQISSSLPEQGEIPKFFQIYFHDSSDIEAQIDRIHDIMKQLLNRKMINMRQYNAPLAKEVAAICFSNETMHVRDIYSQYPEASKTSEAEAKASGTSNIDFGTLLKRELQSQTGLSSILESATIKSSSSINLDNKNINTDDKEYLESRSFIKKEKKRAREETEEV